MIYDYNKNKTELDEIKKLLGITELNLQLYDVDAETLKTICYEPGMPVYYGNEFNSKTENIVCKKEVYENRIILLKIKIKEIEMKVNRVDNIMMETLDYRERYIISKKYIEHYNVKEILANSFKDLGVHISYSTYVRDLKEAEKKLKKYNINIVDKKIYC